MKFKKVEALEYDSKLFKNEKEVAAYRAKKVTRAQQDLMDKLERELTISQEVRFCLIRVMIASGKLRKWLDLHDAIGKE